MAPPSKHPSTRARRNVTSTASTLTADPSIIAPDLPEHLRDCELTVEWWVDVWRSPMAPEFLDADKHGLIMLAQVVHDFWAADGPKAPKLRKDLIGEIRLQRNRFGLTPMDRRSLQWQIEETEEAMRRGAAAAPPVTNEPPANDPRTALHAV